MYRATKVPQNSALTETLMRACAADRALYRAKNAGRNRTSAGDSLLSEEIVEPKPAAV